MKLLIAEYLKDMELAWAASTQRSEKHRLNAVADLLNGDARALWDALEKRGMAPYARVTTWTRVCAFYDWSIENGKLTGPNPYAAFRRKYGRLFKNQYQRSVPSVVWTDAIRRIDALSDRGVREKALELVRTGMRYAEHGTYQDGQVTGKGDKRRRVFLPDGQHISSYVGSYDTFARKLARTGLKPHDLRKLFLNRMVEMGANTFELCELAGWNDLNTARSYIKANSQKLEKLAKRAVKE